MSNDLYVWPRLEGVPATELFEAVRSADVEQLEQLRQEAAIDHDRAATVATGGKRIPPESIRKVQALVRDLADHHGFPARLNRTKVSDFDRPASAILYEGMRIVPADAASEGVWNFLSLVVLPDVALWRYPDGARERLMGLPRNVFRKLWWRAASVGTDLIDVEGGLGEDEFVNVMERTFIAANHAVARAIAKVIFEQGHDSGIARSELMRDVAKRMLRLMGVLTLDVLEPHELAVVVGCAFDDSVEAMSTPENET